MNNASLHLTEHGFAFFQGETDLFRPDPRGFALTPESLTAYAKRDLRGSPRPKFGTPSTILSTQIAKRSGNGSPETRFAYLDGRAPMFDTVPDTSLILRRAPCVNGL